MSDSAAAPAAAVPALRGLHTRFLYLVQFQRGRLREVVAALRAMDLGTAATVWEAASPPPAYAGELLESVAAALFPGAEPGAAGYLRVPETLSTTWFDGALVPTRDGKLVSVRQAPGAAVELFLSDLGTGVLSLPLALEGDEPCGAAALALNHNLAHPRHGVATEIRLPHPADDVRKWSQTLVSVREQVKPAPGRFAPLEDRLGVPGGAVTLTELAARLLRPLEAHGLRAAQKNLALYTVAQFDEQRGLVGRTPAAPFAAFLSALAQGEEPSAATLAEEPVTGVGHMITPRHWVAVGTAGAAHLVANPPDGEADGTAAADVVARARDAYFVPYWLALNQRLVLQRAAGEAQGLALAPGPDAPARLASLRSELLRLAAAGDSGQVSPRAALQRFYRFCLDGLGVPALWQQVRQEVGEVEAQSAALRQVHLSADLARNLRAMVDIQRLLKWIGVLVVSVYLAHLYHMVAAQNDGLRDAFRWFGFEWGELFFAALGFGLAVLLLRPGWPGGSAPRPPAA